MLIEWTITALQGAGTRHAGESGRAKRLEYCKEFVNEVSWGSSEASRDEKQ